MAMNNIVELIIKQEKQLFMRKDPVAVLRELVDDEFIEIGSSSTMYDKNEVIRWLASEDPSEVEGLKFKAMFLSEDVILLTYISVTNRPGLDEPKHAMRSSVWRRSAGSWRMVFHQGTPIK
jgi:hypothetical protein